MFPRGSFKTWLAVIAACASIPLVSTGPVQAQQHTMTRQARGAVVSGRAKFVRALPATRRLQLALMLPLRNQAELKNAIADLYNPKSPNYRHYLSVPQFTERFGPNQADVDAVVRFAQANGLTVSRTSANRMVVDVSGPVASIEKAFHVNMGVYQHPTESRTFYAPDRDPSPQMNVRLWHITGLDDYSKPHSLLRHAPKANVRTEITGSGPSGQYVGSDMRAAYYGGTALTGAGQTIGLYGLNFDMVDVTNYFKTIGQSFNPSSVVTVPINGYDTSCGGCDDGEPVADIVQAYAMAPGVNAVIEYEASNDVDTFTQMATDNIAKQLSASIGFLPADPSTDQPIFMEFAAQGQNLFIASGDSGAYTPADCTDNCNPAFYPEDDPYITAVGGTHIETSGAGGVWQSEISWGGTNPVLACANPTGGSSGGYSTNGFATPSYQKLPGVIDAANQGSTTLRNIPDVAMEADCDNWFCARGTCQGGIGGTSLAAPRWAGYMALVNQNAANNKAPAVGFLNPTLYGIGVSSSYTSEFHDVTSGSNDNGLGQQFNAVTGYDLVTGWGSPNGQSMIETLTPPSTSPYFELTATPTTLTIPPGSTGVTSIVHLTSGNGFSGPVDLSANILGAPAGVTATLSPTSISGSATSTLTVSLTGAGPGGNLTLAITGTSASGVLIQPAYVTLALPTFALSTSPGMIYLNQRGSTTATIDVSPQNGFDGKVTLSSVTGLPSGVTASLVPAKTASKSTLTLAARATTPTGLGVPLAFTGTSGNIEQSATGVTLAVSAATGTGGLGNPVDLSSAFNADGAYTDGKVFSTGLDGQGDAYSASLLTAHRVLNNVQFNLGAANKLNAVSAQGQVIKLPAGHDVTLQLLATGFNGQQAAQEILVNYTDGSSSHFTQSFSDWASPSYNAGESIAVAMPYENFGDGTKSASVPFSLYGYVFTLNSSKTVKSLTLPDNPDLAVFAATLTTQPFDQLGKLSLASDFNVAGLFNDGVTFPATGGMDGGGDGCTLSDGCADVFSAQQLGLSTNTPPQLVLKGIPFHTGPVNSVDCLTNCIADEVALPAGPGAGINLAPVKRMPYSTMTMLGTAVDGSHTGTVTVKYLTGPSDVFTQTFSDWCSYGKYANESIAVGGIERINSDGTLNTGASCNLYSYTYALDSTRVVEKISLANTDQTSEALVLSVTLQPK